MKWINQSMMGLFTWTTGTEALYLALSGFSGLSVIGFFNLLDLFVLLRWRSAVGFKYTSETILFPLESCKMSISYDKSSISSTHSVSPSFSILCPLFSILSFFPRWRNRFFGRFGKKKLTENRNFYQLSNTLRPLAEMQ